MHRESRRKVPIIGAALGVCAIALLLAGATAKTSKESDSMDSWEQQTAETARLPAIDTMRPARVETAAFGLG